MTETRAISVTVCFRRLICRILSENANGLLLRKTHGPWQMPVLILGKAL